MDEIKRPRGRPKDTSKRVALLDAARDLFLSAGPNVTTEQVAAHAGVAKSTLYANFPDKAALIEAVLRREADRTITDEEFNEYLQSEMTPETLTQFGVRYLSFVNSAELAGWDRLLSAFGMSEPDLTRHFFDIGPGRNQRLLEELLAHAIHQDLLEPVRPDWAADLLTGLWLGFVNLEIKLGVRAPLSREEVFDRVKRGLLVFLQVYGKDVSNNGHKPAPRST